MASALGKQLPLAVSALIAALVSLGVASLLSRNAQRLGLVDHPTARSSHVAPTPRGGGVGLAAGLGLGSATLALLGAAPNRAVLALLLAAAVIAILGAWDDLRSIAARYRLLVQVVVATALTVWLGPIDRFPLPPPLDLDLGWLAVPMTVLWLTAVTNFYNFMDGIDGLATGQAVASSIGIGVAGIAVGATNLAVILAAAGVGFILLNRPPARIFLGDVGSTMLGFVLAATPLLAPETEKHRALLAVAIGLSIFLLDPTITLLRRMRVPTSLGFAHREHTYQRLAALQRRHGPTALLLVGAGLILSVVGGVWYRAGGPGWLAVVLGVAAYGSLVFVTVRLGFHAVKDGPETEA